MLADRLVEPRPAQLGNRVAKGADAGQHEFFGARSSSAGERRSTGFGSEFFKGFLHAPQIAHAVVDDFDHGRVIGFEPLLETCRRSDTLAIMRVRLRAASVRCRASLADGSWVKQITHGSRSLSGRNRRFASAARRASRVQRRRPAIGALPAVGLIDSAGKVKELIARVPDVPFFLRHDSPECPAAAWSIA